jgi:hypothetical protein
MRLSFKAFLKILLTYYAICKNIQESETKLKATDTSFQAGYEF